MSAETEKKRNIPPKETSRIPGITLLALLCILLGLLYVGYEYIVDDSSNAEEIIGAEAERTQQPVALVPSETGSGASSSGKSTPAPAPKSEEPKKETSKKESVRPVDPNLGGERYSYTVSSGETLSGISSRFNLKPETLKSLNPDIDFNSGLKSGAKVNVRIRAIHTVGPGDVLRVVSEKYGITKAQLMKANGKSKDFAERGEKLVIPFAERK